MTLSTCFICGKESNSLEKLFQKCRHESACFDCLRKKYVKDVQRGDADDAHFVVTKYPLQCFHPECRRLLRNTQVERFCISDEEKKNYHIASRFAKVLHSKLGQEWKELYSIREALGCDLCRCPTCKILITKNGGCDHMTCLCGAEFSWRKNSCCSLQDFEDKSFHPTKATPKLVSQKKDRPAINTRDDNVCYLDYIDSFEEEDDECLDEGEGQELIDTKMNSPLGTSTSVYQNPPKPIVHHQSEVLLHIIQQPSNSWSVLEEDEGASEGSSSSSVCILSFSDTKEDHEVSYGRSSSDDVWEEVSEIASVVSLASSCTQSKTIMSFAEVARQAPGIRQKRANRPCLKPPPQKNPVRVKEESPFFARDDANDDDPSTDFDADFILEGTKCSRGGKQKFLYNRQPKKKYTIASKYMRSNYSGYW